MNASSSFRQGKFKFKSTAARHSGSLTWSCNATSLRNTRSQAILFFVFSDYTIPFASRGARRTAFPFAQFTHTEKKLARTIHYERPFRFVQFRRIFILPVLYVRKFTKIPWAVSGEKMVSASPATLPICVLNIRFNWRTSVQLQVFLQNILLFFQWFFKRNKICSSPILVDCLHQGLACSSSKFSMCFKQWSTR